ncbi:MAG: hypothetical protein LBG07_03160, partial [Treponema sp.]|nr:hypothetical protein [Treponema sp.]
DDDTGGTVNITGAVTVELGGAIEVKEGGSASLTGEVKVAGKIEVTDGGSAELGDNVTVETGGGISASGTGSTVNVPPGSDVQVDTSDGADVIVGEPNTPSTPDTPSTPSTPTYPAFSRPSNSTAYTLTSYNDSSGVAVLNGTTYSVTDPALQSLFKAIYEPNRNGSTDTVEQGKTAIAYTSAISSSVLSLFKITIGASSAADKVEITGTGLPTESTATTTNLIIIDIGIPGANNSLPTFYIPNQALGDSTSGNYVHIRLRVNQGAELVILANNDGYINNGVGSSCPTGFFNNGTVEVMTGGKLRDGAYEGFPLGSNAVIVNHAGSYLSIGPEPGTTDATSLAAVYNAYYAGYLIAPSGNGSRIEWDNSNTNGYLEVRPGKLALSGNVTVKKAMGLIYDVFFIGNTTVTIDASAAGSKPSSYPPATGLLVSNDKNSDCYDFFGQADAKIVVKKWGIIDKRLLDNTTSATSFLINDTNADITITNGGGGTTETYVGDITGSQNWNISSSLSNWP